jgi:hypothetical protein
MVRRPARAAAGDSAPDATLTEMLQQLTKTWIRYFPDRPMVGMDSEGKNPIAKVQLAIYNSVYILDVSTARGQQDLDSFSGHLLRQGYHRTGQGPP